MMSGSTSSSSGLELTRGAARSIWNHQQLSHPTVQVIHITAANEGAEDLRYRLAVSDGDHWTFGWLATQNNALVHNKQVLENSIIKLTDYMVNGNGASTTVIFLNIEVIATHASKIGDPQPVTNLPENQHQNQQPRQYQQQYQQQQQPQQYQSASSYQNSNASYQQYGQDSYGQGYGQQGPVPSNPARVHTVEIANLNPYMSSWTIKARVTAKSNIRTWSNARGEGKLFSVDLLDAAGGEIRCTMFNDVADRWFDVLHEGQVYLITKGQLKVANRQFTHLKCDYEITLNRDGEITPVQEDDSIQKQVFDFRGISSLPDIEKDQYVDVIGIVSSVSAIATITSRSTQREVTKRSLQIVDQSNTSVELTIWGKDAETYSEAQLAGNPVVAVKGARVSDFGGRSLSTVMSSQFVIQPDIPEAHQLRAWFDQRGGVSAPAPKSLSSGRGGASLANLEAKTCAQIKEENLGLRDPSKPDMFTLTAAVSVLQFNPERQPWYLACPNPDCKKKVTDTGSGQWRCEKCNKTYPSCIPRYILSFVVADATGSQWISGFNDVVETVLQGRTAEEMRTLFESGDVSTVQAAFRSSNFREFTLGVRAKCDTMDDTQRLRCTAMSAAPVDYKDECRKALSAIQAYN